MAQFDYKSEKFENIPCNLCGMSDFYVLAKSSGNGHPAQTCICRQCGLIYINPRMDKESYDNYYKYFYREDRASAKGFQDGGGVLESNFENARKFGSALAIKLKNFLLPGLTIDVGSSTGGALYGLREAVPNLNIFGIEPSLEESGYAQKKGVRTFTGLFENFIESGESKKIGQAANILCVRSLNHLLNPRMFFEWAYAGLKPGGHLILSVKNFRHQVRRAGRIEAGVQIDHVYMFTPENLKRFVESVGFKTVFLDSDEYKSTKELSAQKRSGMPVHHMLLAGKKEKKTAIAPRPALVGSEYKKLRFQFWKPYLKLYYLLAYSHRFNFLRR